MARLADQLTALATMSPAQLRTEWRRVCQTQPPARLTTDLLRRGIGYRLQKRVHGGLPSSHARELDRLVRRRLAEVPGIRGAGAIGPDRDEPRLRPGTRLGSGPVDQSQKMTVAASAVAEKKTVGYRS